MPDGDEIDDVEYASVDDDSPPPRNRQRLSCLRGVSMRTKKNWLSSIVPDIEHCQQLQAG
jgi:hypothetical protein